MREIYIAASARRVLGPEGVAAARSQPLTGWACTVCTVPLDDREPASVQVTYDGVRIAVDYAHPACLKSTVRRVAKVPNPIDPDIPQDIRVSALVRERNGQPEAALLTQIQAQMLRDPGSGEFTDLMIAELLSVGFTLVEDLGQGPAVQPEWLAMILPGMGHAPVKGNAVRPLVITGP